MHLDARAAQGVEEGGAVGVAVQRQAQRAQALAEGRDGVVAHSAYAAAAQINHGERLQHVVELRGGEADIELLICADPALVLEISHAVFVEHDAADGNLFIPISQRRTDGGPGGGGFRACARRLGLGPGGMER